MGNGFTITWQLLNQNSQQSLNHYKSCLYPSVDRKILHDKTLSFPKNCASLPGCKTEMVIQILNGVQHLFVWYSKHSCRDYPLNFQKPRYYCLERFYLQSELKLGIQVVIFGSTLLTILWFITHSSQSPSIGFLFLSIK